MADRTASPTIRANTPNTHSATEPMKYQIVPKKPRAGRTSRIGSGPAGRTSTRGGPGGPAGRTSRMASFAGVGHQVTVVESFIGVVLGHHRARFQESGFGSGGVVLGKLGSAVLHRTGPKAPRQTAWPTALDSRAHPELPISSIPRFDSAHRQQQGSHPCASGSSCSCRFACAAARPTSACAITPCARRTPLPT